MRLVSGESPDASWELYCLSVRLCVYVEGSGRMPDWIRKPDYMDELKYSLAKVYNQIRQGDNGSVEWLYWYEWLWVGSCIMV